MSRRVDSGLRGFRVQLVSLGSFRVAGMVAVGAALVAVMQPWVQKPPFLETAAWGLLLVASFWGYGSGLRELLGGKRADAGLEMVWGASLLTAVGGVLAAVSRFGAGIASVLVAFGVVLLLRRIGKDAASNRAESRESSERPISWPVVGLWLFLGAVVVVSYLGAVADPNTVSRQWDDDTAYLVFVKRLLETGSLIDPFSARRLTCLGGQTLGHALVFVHGSANELNTFDHGICLILLTALVTGHRFDGKRLPSYVLAGAMLFFLTLRDTSINIGPHLSGAVFLLGQFRTHDWLGEGHDAPHPPERGMLHHALIHGALPALVAAAACTLRQNYAPIAVFTLVTSTLFFVRASAQLAWPRRWQLAGWTALAFAVAMGPWLVLSYRSNGTIFFPLSLGTARPSLLFRSASATWLDEVRTILEVLLDNEPIKTLPLLLLATPFLLDGDRPTTRPLLSTAIGFLVGLFALTHSVTADTQTVSRYLTGPALAFSVAVMLSAYPAIVRLRARHVGAGAALAAAAVVLQIGVFGPASTKRFDAMMGRIALRLREARAADPERLERAFYRRVQSKIPSGARVAVMVDRPYHFDFARNDIYNLDYPGYSSLPPGQPFFEGPEPVVRYFRKNGIRYVIFVDSDDSYFLYRRAFWVDRFFSDVPLWRLSAPYFVDAIDTLAKLGEAHEPVYRERGVRVIDLEKE